MPKVNYNGITFDSDLEVNYYKYLKENNIPFCYQNEYEKTPIKVNLGRRKTYLPDFVVYDAVNEIITIIETKGYAKWSANEDNNIMDFMNYQVKENQSFLINWLKEAQLYISGYEIKYRRIRYNKTFGWVDYKWKNPNSIANKRKAKINDLSAELKELKEFKKNALRYFGYHLKLVNNEKLTKAQREWYYKYVEEINKMVAEL